MDDETPAYITSRLHDAIWRRGNRLTFRTNERDLQAAKKTHSARQSPHPTWSYRRQRHFRMIDSIIRLQAIDDRLVG